MKKILMAVAALAAISFASCSKADKAASEESNDFKMKIENCTNADSIAIYVDRAQAYAQKLAAEGKVEEAKKYLADIQPIVEKKAPALVSTFNAVKEAVDKFPASADSLKNAATDSLRTAGAAAVDSVKGAVAAKAGEAVENVKQGVFDAASDAADKASAAVENAAQSAKEKAVGLLK